MANRRTRNATILAKIGSTYGTDAVPTGASNAILVSNLQFTPLEAQNVDRNFVRSYMGASENLVGTGYGQIAFEVEATGSGTAGTAPSWGVLLRACGFAETLTASTRVDYLPISTTFEWVDVYVYMDGVQHKLLGCRGSFSLDLSQGGTPKLKFTLRGLTAAPSAATPSGVDYSTWLAPQVMTNTNTPSFKLGATHSAAGAPALTSGTAYAYSKLNFDSGNDIQFIPLIGSETVELMDRKVTGDVTLDLAAADDVTFMATVKANTLQSFGVQHGTVTGRKLLVFAPNVQIIQPAYDDMSGKLMNAYKLVVPPSGTGNNELRIVTSF